MKFQLEDLGIATYGDCWLTFRYARHPKTGADLALCSLSKGGFMLVDPRAQNAIQVLPGRLFDTGWGIGQAPDGSIYQAFYDRHSWLVRWNWEGTTAARVAELPFTTCFSLDIAPDGRVYMPDYHENVMFCYDPLSGKVSDFGSFSQFGDHIQMVSCGRDGLVYVSSITYSRGSFAVALRPQTGEKFLVDAPAGQDPRDWHASEVRKDAAGHVLAPLRRWGREVWYELVDGKPVEIDQKQVRLAGGGLPLAFEDGGYVSQIKDKEFTHVQADGKQVKFTIEREDSPLRIFSLETGAARVWGGTFIPLTLFSYDPAGGRFTGYGNPTRTNGEIYNSVFSKGKLFMASYTQATLTRYAPEKPWRSDESIQANPAHLGLMKEEGLPLQRPHGKALDTKGNVYFAAHGDYGCEDSGICRIDPDTEDVTRWIYPDTNFGALIYLSEADRLLVSENRKSEPDTIRFTFICPRTGKVLDSRIMIRDKGDVTSWLHEGGDWVYGMHAYRATLFAYSLKEGRIVAELRELGYGDNCYNMLIFGPDGKIWGLASQCVYAVTRDLKHKEVVTEYVDNAGMNAYRFGMVYGPDGNIYFPNGTHLMRIRIE